MLSSITRSFPRLSLTPRLVSTYYCPFRRFPPCGVHARLACLIHAANVHSEPESNPSIFLLCRAGGHPTARVVSQIVSRFELECNTGEPRIARAWHVLSQLAGHSLVLADTKRDRTTKLSKIECECFVRSFLDTPAETVWFTDAAKNFRRTNCWSRFDDVP